MSLHHGSSELKNISVSVIQASNKSLCFKVESLVRLLHPLAHNEIGQCSLATLHYFLKNMYSYLKHCSRAKLQGFFFSLGFFSTQINCFHMELLMLDLKFSVRLC